MESEPKSPLQQATIIWDGPHCLGFNTKASRLRSYVHWPRGMNPSHESLSTAGFYFTGTRHYLRITIHCYIHYLRLCSTHTSFTGTGDCTKCFHCGGILNNWRSTDDAWWEHAFWFPYCVYVRYIKGEEYIRNVRRCCSCIHCALTCSPNAAAPRSPSRHHHQIAEDVYGICKDSASQQHLPDTPS